MTRRIEIKVWRNIYIHYVRLGELEIVLGNLYVDKSKLFLERLKETWPRVENINQ